MSSPDSTPSDDSVDASRLTFIETAQYSAPDGSGSSHSLPLPQEWDQHFHPNGDVYYCHRRLRLITPDNIRRPEILRHVLDAREDHLELLAEDPAAARLPPDLEITVRDATDSSAVIGLCSREVKQAFEWNERAGRIAVRPKQHYWAHVAEYPSHHPRLPPGAEHEFVAAVREAKIQMRDGEAFPFTEQQLDQILALYERHRSRNNVPALGWLIGVVMPLESVVNRLNGGLEAMIEDLRV